MTSMSTIPDDLACKELVEIITDYLEGRLPAGEKARFEKHLEGCGGCRNYLEQMRQTITLSGKLTEDSVQPEARDELLSVFRKWKQGRE